jgi:cytochrome P450
VIEYQRYYGGLIEARRAQPRDDLASALVTSRVPGVEPLHEAELVWQLMGLLAAGHETTTDALLNLTFELVRGDDDRWATLRDNPSLVPAYVEEGLRYLNPVLGLPRTTTEDIQLGGRTIPAGSEVLVAFASANRDVAAIERANCFDPHRSGNARAIAFGYGAHFCIGARLARLQMRVALEVLAARLPHPRLPGGFQPEYLPHPFLWGLARLPLVWDRV